MLMVGMQRGEGGWLAQGDDGGKRKSELAEFGMFVV